MEARRNPSNKQETYYTKYRKRQETKFNFLNYQSFYLIKNIIAKITNMDSLREFE
jgi:hypothetical protein